MEIPVINDTHFGARNDSPVFIDYFLDFFEQDFFPYCKENGVKSVIHLGDFLDRRKYVNFNTLNQVRTRFVKPLVDMGIQMHCILGNHDTYFKNTNDINSLQEVFDDDFIIYHKPSLVEIEGVSFSMIPWINKENYEETVEFMKNNSSSVLCGHLELNGYQVLQGVRFENGMDDDILKKYETVLSGHFHFKQSRDNVHYLGTQYQITFSDLNVPKGFHVFDTSDRSLEFIENPRKIFYSLEYDDENNTPEEILNKDFSKYAGCFVKIFVINKNKPFTFDRFLDKMYSVQPSNVTVVEDVDDELDDDAIDLAKGTLEIIYEEIDSIQELDDPARLKKLFQELYMESLSL